MLHMPYMSKILGLNPSTTNDKLRMGQPLIMPSAGKSVKQQELSMLAKVQSRTAKLEDSWQFLTKLNILLPCDPKTSLLGIYPK